MNPVCHRLNKVHLSFFFPICFKMFSISNFVQCWSFLGILHEARWERRLVTPMTTCWRWHQGPSK